MKKVLAMLIAISLYMPLVVGAGEKSKSPEDRFKARDKDGNGKLTKEEFLATVAEAKQEKAGARFAAMDKDESGDLSLEEYKEGMMKKRKD